MKKYWIRKLILLILFFAISCEKLWFILKRRLIDNSHFTRLQWEKKSKKYSRVDFWSSYRDELRNSTSFARFTLNDLEFLRISGVSHFRSGCDVSPHQIISQLSSATRTPASTVFVWNPIQRTLEHECAKSGYNTESTTLNWRCGIFF